MLFPWQQSQWQTIEWARQKNRLPHAILLSGPLGVGKMQFAEHLASSLFCQCADDHFLCSPCQLITARTHPDVLWVEAEKSGHAIKIDHVRALTEFVAQSSFQGDKRVVIVHPADSMNHHAANALLKTLEEPAPGSILILVSHQHGRLPATILSRCQQIKFTKPAFAAALAWMIEESPLPATECELLLRLAHGAPLAALRLKETEILALREKLFSSLLDRQLDPLILAEQIQTHELLTTLDLLIDILLDVSKLNLGHADLIHLDYQERLQQMAKRISLQHLAAFIHYLQQIRQQVGAGVNLNKLLLLETIFIHWLDHLAGKNHGAS